MTEHDEKRDQDDQEVEGHIKMRDAERTESDDDDAPDVEGHVKRNSPSDQRPRPRPS